MKRIIFSTRWSLVQQLRYCSYQLLALLLRSISQKADDKTSQMIGIGRTSSPWTSSGSPPRCLLRSPPWRRIGRSKPLVLQIQGKIVARLWHLSSRCYKATRRNGSIEVLGLVHWIPNSTALKCAKYVWFNNLENRLKHQLYH